MDNYFIHNRETGKLELHFDKATYDALTAAQKAEIRGAFLWGRNSGCWISRAKEPHLSRPTRIAESIGLTDAGQEGERRSFAEQMEIKAERAERRAERFEHRAGRLAERGQQLQKPLNDMRGDTSFFTQPNINTASGRAFTRRRQRMFDACSKGFELLRESDYWKERAAKASRAADQPQLKDKAFVGRRINDCESRIRKLQKSIEESEARLKRIEAGESVIDRTGLLVVRGRGLCLVNALCGSMPLNIAADDPGAAVSDVVSVDPHVGIHIAAAVKVITFGYAVTITVDPFPCIGRIAAVGPLPPVSVVVLAPLADSCESCHRHHRGNCQGSQKGKKYFFHGQFISFPAPVNYI